MVQPYDEVSALVLEVGSCTTKAGYAGEDTPQAAFPTAMGHIGMEDSYIFAEDTLMFRENMEIKNPLKDGLVDDWDLYEKIWDYSFARRLRVDTADHPLMICEPSFNTNEQRQRIAELAFEKFNVPAFYLAKQAVLSAFSAGRSSGMVIDLGAETTTVTPVYEGYALKRGVINQKLAGNAITAELTQLLEEQSPAALVPQFKIAKRKAVDIGKPPEALQRKLSNVTESFNKYALDGLVDNLKECVCSVSESRYNEEVLAMRPQKTFEFPNGYNNYYAADRFRIPEILFDPQQYMKSNNDFISVQNMVQNSLENVEQDSRAQLLNNIVVVGGTSLIPNLVERLNNEIYTLMPGLRIKMYASGNSVERKFSSWIGGSILSSLGSFHQLWVSKQEYEEHGPAILEKRCQ